MDDDAVAAVRPARPDDHAGWRRLWLAYDAEGRPRAAPPPEAVTAAAWRRLLDPREPMEALLAVRAGRPVGLAHLVFHPTPAFAGPACLLQDLFVEAAERGRGTGRALLAAAFDRARAAGARRVHWHALESNAAATRLYDRVAARTGHVVYRKEL